MGNALVFSKELTHKCLPELLTYANIPQTQGGCDNDASDNRCWDGAAVHPIPSGNKAAIDRPAALRADRAHRVPRLVLRQSHLGHGHRLQLDWPCGAVLSGHPDEQDMGHRGRTPGGAGGYGTAGPPSATGQSQR